MSSARPSLPGAFHFPHNSSDQMSSLSEVLARLMPGALAAMRLMSGGQGINGTVVLSPQAARHLRRRVWKRRRSAGFDRR
jgi:hypothetical protein